MAEVKSRHPKTDIYLAERAKGMTYTAIAEKYGVTYQAVAQTCGKYDPSHFKLYTVEEVVYPHLRRWLNDNKITRKEFARMIGRVACANATNAISSWFRGRCYPTKPSIDKILAATGLTYDKLFEREGA